MASFGEELRRERELRDISLKEISEATKISIRFLEALEQNNFDILPGGVFNRGFIRAYARFIGVDGEEMVNAYLHEVATREPRPPQAARASRAGATVAPVETPPGIFRPESRPSHRPEPVVEPRSRGRHAPAGDPIPYTSAEPSGGRNSTALWVLVVVVLMVGAGLVILSLSGNRALESQPADPRGQALKARLSRGEPGSRPAEPNLAEGSLPIDATAAAGTADPNVSGPAAGPLVDSGQQPPVAGEIPAPGVAGLAPAAPPVEPAAAGLPPAPVQHTLRIHVTEVSRVVIECNGKVSLDQELWPGATRTLPCAEPILLSAVNAGAVHYTLDGGHAVTLGEIGESAEGRMVAPLDPPADHDGGKEGKKDSHAGL